jgi:hypothetical protein
MPNHVNCCFNSKKHATVEQISNLVNDLAACKLRLKNKFDPNVFEKFIEEWLINDRASSIDFEWEFPEAVFEAKLWRFLDENRERMTFAIQDTFFLPGKTITREPLSRKDEHFALFLRTIEFVIKRLQPTIGAIDEMADLLYEPLKIDKRLASWGNYFSRDLLAQWSSGDCEKIRQLVDEFIEIENCGILIFIHPLAFNQAYTARHEEMETLIRKNRAVMDLGLDVS